MAEDWKKEMALKYEVADRIDGETVTGRSKRIDGEEVVRRLSVPELNTRRQISAWVITMDAES